MKARVTIHRTYQAVILLLISVLLFFSAGGSLSIAAPLQDDPVIDAIPMDADMMTIDDDLLPAASVKESGNPKLDSGMNQLASTSLRSIEETAVLAESMGMKMSGGLVQVNIATSAEDLDAAVQAVVDVGGEVTGVGYDDSEIQAWLPVDSLESITASESVYYVQQPMYAVLMGDLQAGASSTEALTAMNVDAWHAAGIKGAGVKVAIIDGGFKGYKTLLGTDLPAAVTAKNYVDGETDDQMNNDQSNHGTACAEVVHDIAPEAVLFLVKVSTNIDLQEAVTYAIAQGVDIISTSIGWYIVTPGDGTGQFEDMAAIARDAGILWVTAASNNREMHWGGLYNDLDSDDFQNFAPSYDINYYGPGENKAFVFEKDYFINVYLRWNDWTDVDQDYDLYLVRNIWNGSSWEGWDYVAYSENYQTGTAGQAPREWIFYTTEVDSAAYGFLIKRYDSDTVVNFEVHSHNVDSFNFNVHPRSLANLADAPSALTVAALDVNSPYPQEYYSSEGPTNGPGGALTGGFTKPDLSGFANVSTQSYGTVNPFNGTSSATPHVSGAAALVLCANPTFTPDDIQEYLEDHAVDMGTAGMDTVFGYGRVWLDSPTGKEEEFNQYLPFVR